MKTFAKGEVIKRPEKDSRIGKAYFAGMEGNKYVIQLLIKEGKGKGKKERLKKQIEKKLLKNCIVRFEEVEDTGEDQDETTNITAVATPMTIGDVKVTNFEYTGKDSMGNDVVIPAGTEVLLTNNTDGYKFLAEVEGKICYLNLPAEAEVEKTMGSLPVITVIEKDDNSLVRLEQLKKEDWDSIFHDVSSEKIVGILKSFTKEEQAAFLENGGLQYFVAYELSNEDCVKAIKGWDIPILEKLRLFDAAELGQKVDYDIFRQLIVGGDWTGFNLSDDLHLINFGPSDEGFAQFMLDAGIVLNEDDFLVHNGVEVISAQDLGNLKRSSPGLALTGHDLRTALSNITPPIYDDVANKQRVPEVTTEDLELLMKLEEGRATPTDRAAILSWFQKNALIELHAILDVSEMQLKDVLHKYSGGLFNQFKADFLALMEERYGDRYTFRIAITNPNVLAGANRNAQIQAKRVLKDEVQRALGKKHPVIYAFQGNYAKLVSAFDKSDDDKIRTALEDRVITLLANIDYVRETLRSYPEYVWSLNNIISNTFGNLGIQRNSETGIIVINHQKEYKEDKEFYDKWLAVTSVGLSIIAACSSGGVSFLATVGAAGVGTYDLAREVSNYVLEDAVANTALTQAQALTNEKPELLWVALSALGALGDVVAAAKLMKTIKIGPIESLTDAERYAGTVAQKIAIQRGIPIDDVADSPYQKLLKMVEAKAVAHFDEVAVGRLTRRQQLDRDFQKTRTAFMKSLTINSGGPIMSVKAFTYYAVVAAKKGMTSLSEVFEEMGLKVDDVLQNNNIEIPKELNIKVFQDIFDDALAVVAKEQALLKASIDAVSDLRKIPLDEVLDNQAAITKAWDDYAKNAPPIELKIDNKTVELKFDEENGNLLTFKKGKWEKPSSTEKEKIYESLGLTHAAKNHDSGIDIREVAERTTKKGANAQNSIFKNDEIFVRTVEFLREKCLGSNKTIDIDKLVKNGTVTVAEDGKYIFEVPIPKDKGVLFFNTKIGNFPSWIKNPKPYLGDKKLAGVVELPVTRVRIVFKVKDGNTDIKVVSSYVNSF